MIPTANQIQLPSRFIPMNSPIFGIQSTAAPPDTKVYKTMIYLSKESCLSGLYSSPSGRVAAFYVADLPTALLQRAGKR